MNVAEAIAQAVVAEGAKLAAGITGQSVGHIADALSMNPNMTMIYVRQERVAVDIADGYARVTGNPAIVFTDAGPAATNLLGGWVNSWGDSTPVLFIAGPDQQTIPRQMWNGIREQISPAMAPIANTPPTDPPCWRLLISVKRVCNGKIGRAHV